MINMNAEYKIEYNKETKMFQIIKDWRDGAENKFTTYEEAWIYLNKEFGIRVCDYIVEDFEEDYEESHSFSSEYVYKTSILSITDIETGLEVDKENLNEDKEYLYEVLDNFVYNESDERNCEYYFCICKPTKKMEWVLD